MRANTIVILAAGLSAASAATTYKGFNYGATFTDGSAKGLSDFTDEFNTAQKLNGVTGFTSARLFTTIQGGTTNTPTTAIQAAINTNTTLLLGLWASGGDADFANEVAALTTAISQSGEDFTKLIAGISVGSEDLYRISPTGIENDSGAGAGPDVITNYIAQVKTAIGSLNVPVGHVDTWTAWVNASNSAVITACDFIGMDAYPYFQTTMANSIENGNTTFWNAYDATVGAVNDASKPVWITETGWPVSGATSNQAVPSVANAKTYWDEVGCAAFDKISTWWYTLQDAAPTTPNPSFGIVGSTLSETALFDLTLNC